MRWHPCVSGIDTSEAIRDSPEDFCSGGVYPRLFGGVDVGGYKTCPYEDDTRAPLRHLAPSKIVVPFSWLLAIDGKSSFRLIFAPGFLPPYFLSPGFFHKF